MSSIAYTGHLIPLLEDADNLVTAYRALRSTSRSRGHELIALNRATVVVCVSAWEAYIEELVRESLEAMRPSAPPMGIWPSLNAAARAAIGRFNTPNTDQVRVLISDSIGLPDIPTSWTWPNCSPAQSRARLQEAMDLRHAVAHGVNPRPPIDNRYAGQLPEFFRRLGRCTDAAIRNHLVQTLGVANPWPS